MISLIIFHTQVDLAIDIEQKLPWILRQKLKKSSHKVEKNPSESFFLPLYHKIYEKLTGNSFKELEKKVSQLESQEKLQGLLQGIGVCSYDAYTLKITGPALNCFWHLDRLLTYAVVSNETFNKNFSPCHCQCYSKEN